MKSNCKEVKNAIRAHILDFYTSTELVSEVEGLMRNCSRLYPTVYHAVRHMVEGGCFLVYNNDIINFLNGLGINPNGKEYDCAQSFELYCHLLARDAGLIVKHA